MKVLRWSRWASILFAAACQFDRPADVGPPADAPPPDAPQVCTPNTTTCAGGFFTACDADGQFVAHVVPNGGIDGSPITITMDDYACPLGCHATQPRCADVDALNGFNAALDTADVSPEGLDVVLPRMAGLPAGSIVIDTSSIDAGFTTITDVDGAPVRVPARVVTQVGAPEILVLMTRTFTVSPGATISVRGSRALGIAAHFDVYLAGALDLSAGRSGTIGSVSDGACTGQFSPDGGGGGGGGNAGVGGLGTDVGTSGKPTVTDEPVIGGCGGGLGFSIGGGAVQMVSRTRIVLAPTSFIDLTAMGGFTTFGRSEGGGSGGTAVLMAPTIALEPGSVIAGRGGSGAAHGPSESRQGAPGARTGTDPAPSVTCTGCGTSGAGGTEVTPAGHASGSGTADAGGGGSVGMCRAYNATGVLILPPGTMKVGITRSALRTR